MRRGGTLAAALGFVLSSAGVNAGGEALFLDKVKPLLELRCVNCHGSGKVKGGLRLDSLEGAIKGGESGPAIVPGKPEESLLLTAVTHTAETLKMPPKEKLTPQDIEVLKAWIEAGAPWPAEEEEATPAPGSATSERIGDAWSDPRNPVVRTFGGRRLDLWSLKPVTRPEPPETRHAEWARNDLDRFILDRLDRDGTAPPPMADPRTLARRMTFDLTGLPPTPERIRRFEDEWGEGGDDAAGRLVDELLASPRFGEHFARLWLDTVRYSDSNGFDWDEFRPHAWRYRDHVIRTFNEDKPFDEFIREQLAGDELVAGEPEDARQQGMLLATGFLRLGPWDNAAQLFNEQDRARSELLVDLTESTASAFLGLTMSCCRCHDHKYDPLTQADHYRMRAFFEPVRFADDLPLDPAEEQRAIRKHNEAVEERLGPVKAGLEELEKREKTSEGEGGTPLTEEEQARKKELEREADKLEEARRRFTTGLVVQDDAKEIPATHILFQGDHKAKREAVAPGFISALDPNAAEIPPAPNAESSGRRLALANWIASPSNPLTARVFVNRIWDAMTGRPLVGTPNDFGLAGEPPEDPALLDWLASEFMARGWSVKELVRLIAGSATYRQAVSEGAPGFARRVPRRLTAEQLRDALLAVSGLLTDKSEGPPVWPELPPELLAANPAFLDDNKEKTKGWYPSPEAEQFCRSIFLVQKRNTRVPILETFDLPENSVPCARRQVSTVAPQALSLLNSPLVIAASEAFARRVGEEAGDDPAAQVNRAWELALQRAPGPEEHASCIRLLSGRSLPELCRVLVNLNEFAYVD